MENLPSCYTCVFASILFFVANRVHVLSYSLLPILKENLTRSVWGRSYFKAGSYGDCRPKTARNLFYCRPTPGWAMRFKYKISNSAPDLGDSVCQVSSEPEHETLVGSADNGIGDKRHAENSFEDPISLFGSET